MKFLSLLEIFCILLLCFALAAPGVLAQRPGSSTPREEKLLNGLKVLMWSDPAATDVKVSIRIHSGSSFDPLGKEGVMKLLADNIFPNAESRNFYTDDLGGSIDVVSDYDYIQINASAKSSEFVTLVEALAQAVSNPTIDKDTTIALKKALTEKLAALEKDPAYISEQAAAKRLFGAFPYGRPQMGSVASLERIDFADLQFARDRLLSADNATITISGNFNSDHGFRAARRFFGAWMKSDKRIPSTFRQPDEPDTKPLELTVDGAAARTSFALRGLARNDPDYAASLILEKVIRARAEKSSPNLRVLHRPRTLPGVITVSAAGSSGFPFALFSDRITEAEFAKARGEAATEFSARPLTDQWLDVDTYRTTVAGDAKAFQTATLADVQRVADRLAKNPIVAVSIRPSAPTQ